MATDLLKKTTVLTVFFLASCMIIGGAVFFYRHEPSTMIWYPQCVTYMTTGLLCPGCGITRAAYYAIHGDIMRSIQCNGLIYFSFLWLIITIFSKKYTLGLAVIYATIVVVYTVLRNLDTAVSVFLRP